MTLYRFILTLDTPAGVTPEETSDYIEAEMRDGAVRCNIDNPFFNLDRDSVKVISFYKAPLP